MPVSQLKQMIEDKVKVPKDKQRLVFAGKQLQDSQTVKQQGNYHLIQSRNQAPPYTSSPKYHKSSHNHRDSNKDSSRDSSNLRDQDRLRVKKDKEQGSSSLNLAYLILVPFFQG